MKQSTHPSAADTERIVAEYSTMLFRIALVILCSVQDAEDAVQTTFLKYMEKAPFFSEAEHEKAWLITVVTNTCRDLCRTRAVHPTVPVEELGELAAEAADVSILAELMSLREEYRTVLYLFYIQGYQTGEIGKLLGIAPAAVRKRLQRGRELLKLEYERSEQA